MNTVLTEQTFTDVIVVVHGIGSQRRFDTARSVATRLAGSKTMLVGCVEVPVAPQPLGYFHGEAEDITSIRLVDDADKLGKTGLARIGVAEVFWADIPQEAQQEGRTLEETKAWARTVVARAQALCAHAKREDKSGPATPDFHLAAEVLEEMIDTIYVLENLTFLAAKAGLFTFDLKQVLEDYLGDVQIVTEFGAFRANIVTRFRKAMESVLKQCVTKNPDVRLHIVAHSEGTVVSFLGLVEALSGKQAAPILPSGKVGPVPTELRVPDWLKYVRGYMTIGSPIDKHLLLWPRLWVGLDPAFADKQIPAGQIKWRNYYDYGDPVGFKLDTARHWLDLKAAKSFQFCGCPRCQHDMGFARYLFPGKAHNDYWQDPDVFEHFIRDVVKPGPEPAKRPQSRRDVRWLSPTLPYVLSFVVLFTGVFILYKAVTAFTHPEYDSMEQIFLIQNLGIKPVAAVSGLGLLKHALAIAVLVAGTTALARLPRLAAGLLWKLLGFAAYLLGCVAYIYGVESESRLEIGSVFDVGGRHPNWATAGILGIALVVGLVALLLARGGKHRSEERRQWLLRKGMRPLLICGVIAIAALVVSQVYPGFVGRRVPLSGQEAELLTEHQIDVVLSSRLNRAQLDRVFVRDEGLPARLKKLDQAESLLAEPPPVWPVLVASAAFLYLWWLGALLFDMSFMWQRYVRGSVTNTRLAQWASHGHLPVDKSRRKHEACRNPEYQTPASA